MKLLKGRKGFTLIELLIVITIIGVLAVALVPRIVGAPAKARDAARKADLQQAATGIELYFDANGSYPTPGAGKCLAGIASNLSGSYLTTVPDDPLVGASGSPGASTQCSDGYTYVRTTDGFILSAVMEQEAAGSDTENIYATASWSSGTTAAFISGLSTTCDSVTGTTPCYYYVFR